MPLPIGVWKANINGHETDMAIESLNPQGIFGGKLYGAPVEGFWDEHSQSISFALFVFSSATDRTMAFFRGYLMRTPPNPEPGRDVVATLTGTIEMTEGNAGVGPFAGATARRHVFGWFAQLTEIL
jgi:hypothetical protein